MIGMGFAEAISKLVAESSCGKVMWKVVADRHCFAEACQKKACLLRETHSCTSHKPGSGKALLSNSSLNCLNPKHKSLANLWRPADLRFPMDASPGVIDIERGMFGLTCYTWGISENWGVTP